MLKPIHVINLTTLTELQLWGLLSQGFDVVDELQLRLLRKG